MPTDYTAATLRAMQAKPGFQLAYRMAIAAWVYGRAKRLPVYVRLGIVWMCFWINLRRGV